MNTIQIYKVSVQNAFQWFGRAWHLFKLQSGLFMLAIFFIFLMNIIAAMSGIVGAVAYCLVQPFLSAGFYHLAFKADNGVESKFGELFIAFGDIQCRKVLLQLGALGLLFATLIAPLGEQLRQSIVDQQTPDSNLFALYLLAQVFYYVFFLFAVPIAYFYHEQSLWRVIKTGLYAVLSNPIAIFVFLILSSLLMFLASFTLFIAMIIVAPVVMIVVYLAFNDILRPAIDFESKDDNDNNDGHSGSGGGSDFKIEV